MADGWTLEMVNDLFSRRLLARMEAAMAHVAPEDVPQSEGGSMVPKDLLADLETFTLTMDMLTGPPVAPTNPFPEGIVMVDEPLPRYGQYAYGQNQLARQNDYQNQLAQQNQQLGQAHRSLVNAEQTYRMLASTQRYEPKMSRFMR